jgi:lipid-binding SYLF domain-containing protein
MRKIIIAIGTLVCITVIQAAQADDDETDYQGLLTAAEEHLSGFGSHSQAEAIINLTGSAKAVVIIPDEIAASMIVGYKRGTGAMFRRHGSEWSDPVFLTFAKYSVGLQAGGSHNEIIIMVLTASVADGLIDGVSNMGGSGGFALGSLGMGSSGGGSIGGGLEMFSVSTRAGLELGGSIENTHVSPAEKFNIAAWGEDYDMKSVLSQPGGKLESAQKLREALIKATKSSFEN